MGAGGISVGADAIGVDIVFIGVGAEPADGVFDVFDAGGEGIGAGEAVIDGDGDVSLGGVIEGGVEEIGFPFVAVAPSAPVDEDNGGAWGIGFFRGHGEIEFPAFVALPVGDIGDEGHAVGDAALDGFIGGDGLLAALLLLALGEEVEGGAEEEEGGEGQEEG